MKTLKSTYTETRVLKSNTFVRCNGLCNHLSLLQIMVWKDGEITDVHFELNSDCKEVDKSPFNARFETFKTILDLFEYLSDYYRLT